MFKYLIISEISSLPNTTLVSEPFLSCVHHVQKCLQMVNILFHTSLEESVKEKWGGHSWTEDYVKHETISNFQGNLWTSETRELTEHQIPQDHKRNNPLIQENNAIEPSLKDHFV